MRKLSLAIGVLFVFSIVNAEEIKIDFDGKDMKKMSIAQAASEIEVSMPAIEKAKPKTEKEWTSVERNIELNAVEKQGEIEKIDYSILQTVNYCEKNNVSSSISEGLKKLLAHGTKEEKIKFLLNTEYIIPDRVVKLEVPDITIWQEKLINKDGVGMCKPTCVKWESKKVCRDKEIWQTACIFGTVVCYTAAGAHCGPAGAVCTLVNRIVPECVDVPVCVETQETCAPGF